MKHALLTAILLQGLSVEGGAVIGNHTYGVYSSVPACEIAIGVEQQRLIAGNIKEVGASSTAFICVPKDPY